jgi:hypothetical protein
MRETKEVLELRDIIIKLDGAIRMLVDGKEIPCHQKLLGIRQKLVAVYKDKCQENIELIVEDHNESH